MSQRATTSEGRVARGRTWLGAAGALFVLALVPAALRAEGTEPAARALDVYIVVGRGATNKVRDKYADLFRNSVFRGHTLTIDESSARAAFLAQFFRSDIVYLGLHANPAVWLIGSGERLTIADLTAACPPAGTRPALVIVSGCSTVTPAGESELARAIGITPATRKRAYIGFDKTVAGRLADAYFRVFFGLWLRPKAGGEHRPDSTYRTLQEAATEATRFIEEWLRRRTTLGEARGSMVDFSDEAAAIGRIIRIVGDSGLTAKDLLDAPRPER